MSGKKDLYVVKTNVQPGFLNVVQIANDREHTSAAFVNFLDKVKEQYDEINLPILAIKPGNSYSVPCDLVHMDDGQPLPKETDGIVDLIARHVEGKEELISPHGVGCIPVKTVVDFTNGDLRMGQVYDKLGEIYNIHPITILDGQ